MAELKVELPKMGESVAEATITTWLKSVGDKIEEDEPIVEIATDKVDSEVPSPCSGILKEALFSEGDVVQVGSIFAVIETDQNVGTEIDDEKVELSEMEVESEILKPLEKEVSEQIVVESTSDRFYSPLVKSIAKKENINQNELDQITGSGANGRVTKKDMLNYLDNKTNQTPNSPVKQEESKPQTPTVISTTSMGQNGEGEIIEMDRMRKMIADHMVHSVHTAPHVTSFVEADVTNLVLWRNKYKKEFENREGEKLTFTPIFIEAVANKKETT
jgi:2-oxoglutarate dehydrogenase E2 component (dihydrolipoamide succinyltransferase)